MVDSVINNATQDQRTIRLPRNGTAERIFYNYQTQVATITHTLVKDTLLMPETMSNIAWNLRADEKQIGGANCRLAEGNFRGRTWRVWYNPEIPVQSGPWKLQGLPGLIVDAQDATGTIRFDLISIMPYSGNECVCLPKIYKTTTKAALASLLEEMRSNPQIISDKRKQTEPSIPLPPGTTMTVKTSIITTPGFKAAVVNNPLELSSH